jgi:CheY-like chemotaxis protein
VIAEDEAIIRLDLKETLEEEGYEVVAETGRGDEAVELVREHPRRRPSSTSRCPGLDGLSAAREIAGERCVGGADPHGLLPARPHRAGP